MGIELLTGHLLNNPLLKIDLEKAKKLVESETQKQQEAVVKLVQTEAVEFNATPTLYLKDSLKQEALAALRKLGTIKDVELQRIAYEELQKQTLNKVIESQVESTVKTYFSSQQVNEESMTAIRNQMPAELVDKISRDIACELKSLCVLAGINIDKSNFPDQSSTPIVGNKTFLQESAEGYRFGKARAQSLSHKTVPNQTKTQILDEFEIGLAQDLNQIAQKSISEPARQKLFNAYYEGLRENLDSYALDKNTDRKVLKQIQNQITQKLQRIQEIKLLAIQYMAKQIASKERGLSVEEACVKIEDKFNTLSDGVLQTKPKGATLTDQETSHCLIEATEIVAHESIHAHLDEPCKEECIKMKIAIEDCKEKVESLVDGLQKTQVEFIELVHDFCSIALNFTNLLTEEIQHLEVKSAERKKEVEIDHEETTRNQSKIELKNATLARHIQRAQRPNDLI